MNDDWYVEHQFRRLIKFIWTFIVVFFELWWEPVVTVPSVTVVVAPASVDVGDSITVSGVVNSDADMPAPVGTAVDITVVDSTGITVATTSATTLDATGAYSASVTIPAGTSPGVVTVNVVALGAVGTATFTHQIKVSPQLWSRFKKFISS